MTITLGKEKFQTLVREKCSSLVERTEKGELLSLTELHRNFLGYDECVGQRPKSKKCVSLDKENFPAEYQGESFHLVFAGEDWIYCETK